MSWLNTWASTGVTCTNAVLPNSHTDDLFLLHRERKGLQTRVFHFEHGCIEAVIVLSKAMSAGTCAFRFHEAPTYEVNDHSIFFALR